MAAINRFDYHYVVLDDHAGAAANVVRELCGRGIRLLAFSSFPLGGGKVQLDLAAEDSDALLASLEDMQLIVSRRKTSLLVRADGGPCTMARMLDELAQARIHVTSVQAIYGEAGHSAALVWVTPEDVPRAAKVLQACETGHDTVDEASEESFPASDSPAWAFNTKR